MKKLLPILLLFSLVACATPEQIALRKQQQEQADFETCQGYGLKAGSEAFGMCRLQLDLACQQQYNSYYAYPPRATFDSSIYYLRR